MFERLLTSSFPRLCLVTALCLATQIASARLAAPSAPRPFAFAPAIYMRTGADLSSWARATGQSYALMAFYNAAEGRCAGTWPDDEAAVLAQARALRSLGGDVILSTGGWNADDLAARCADPASLADVYDALLQRFGADHLDLDPEAGDIHNNLLHDIVDRRSAAMRILQDRFRARGKILHLSVAVAVKPAFGMDADNLYVLQSAKAAGVRIEMIDAMVMDYRDGQSEGKMGPRSIQTLEMVHAQLKTLFPGHDDAALWGMMGALPDLGQNDAEPEIFTLDDARQLESFAEARGLGRLSFWSVGRDNGDCPGKLVSDPTCSGIVQAQWAFSRILGTFARAHDKARAPR
ncbi:MAG TPA: glycosyl hydrolase family 18 protein [Allosphingosinicella sp.]|jgi:chitinase|nr:glycosyl hydrolase family 18 protein [Allosphingosinicella sp.]